MNIKRQLNCEAKQYLSIIEIKSLSFKKLQSKPAKANHLKYWEVISEICVPYPVTIIFYYLYRPITSL
jgi:hypothetical protein